MNDNKGYVLILGGASVHVKLVNAAHKLNYKTIVIDNLDRHDSPAKRISDLDFKINIYDIDRIVDLANTYDIVGVISTHLDPCQNPYYEVCHRLNLPCYGTKKQFFKMTNKNAFKELCNECNVDTILEYSIDEVMNNSVEYPIFIKPVDSRGSRGQTRCYNKQEAIDGIDLAKKNSSNGDIIIEKYIQDSQEIQVTYFFVDGKPYLIRTVDSYNGGEENNLEKVVACSVSPSKYTNEFINTANTCVVKMFEKIGFKNGPIFMQGFYDNGKFRFFDPGLRFPGVDYDLIYPIFYNIDLLEMMVYFAVNGCFNKNSTLHDDMYLLKGKRAAVLFPTVSSGRIGTIFSEPLNENKCIYSYSLRHKVNDFVEWSFNVNQRIAEIDLVSNDTVELKNSINQIIDSFKVYDESNNNMIYAPFDVERIE